MTDWVSSIHGENEIGSCFHIDRKFGWSWNLCEKKAIQYKYYWNFQKFGYNVVVVMVASPKFQSHSIHVLWKNNDQLVMGYYSLLVNKFIKPTALKSPWRKISVFHLHIMTGSTYWIPKWYSRERRTGFISHLIINQFYGTPHTV